MNLPFTIDLKGQVAVVTGGSGIIGGMFSRALGKCGAKVAVLGRRAENGKPVVDDIESEGGEAMAVAANVLDKESLENAKKQILDKWGRIDILVNCARGAVKAAEIPQDQFNEAEEGALTFFTTDRKT